MAKKDYIPSEESGDRVIWKELIAVSKEQINYQFTYS